MRQVGGRKQREITFHASGDAILAGAQFNDEIHKLPSGNSTRIRKGVLRFRTHAEANAHQSACIAAWMAETASRKTS